MILAAIAAFQNSDLFRKKVTLETFRQLTDFRKGHYRFPSGTESTTVPRVDPPDFTDEVDVVFEQREIYTILPHRRNWQLLHTCGVSLRDRTAIATWWLADEWQDGHFEEEAVIPQIFMEESIGHTLGVLVYSIAKSLALVPTGDQSLAVLKKEGFGDKNKHVAKPGDLLQTCVTYIHPATYGPLDVAPHIQVGIGVVMANDTVAYISAIGGAGYIGKEPLILPVKSS